MAVATTLTVIILCFGTRAWWPFRCIKFTDLMGSAIAVRMSLNDKVSGAVHTHEEHGNHDENAPKGSHSGATLPWFSHQRKDFIHIHRLWRAAPPWPDPTPAARPEVDTPLNSASILILFCIEELQVRPLNSLRNLKNGRYIVNTKVEYDS